MWDVRDLLKIGRKGARKDMAAQPDKESMMTQIIARLQNMTTEQLEEMIDTMQHPPDPNAPKEEGEEAAGGTGGGGQQQPGGPHQQPGQPPHQPGQQPGQQPQKDKDKEKDKEKKGY
jgi:hypothetical protein